MISSQLPRLAVLMAALATSASAQITLLSSAGDGSVFATGSGLTANTAVTAGFSQSPFSGVYPSMSGILFFQLPSLPSGEVVDTATFNLRIAAANTPAANLDLYLIGVQTGTTLNSAWHYAGADDSANFTRLQDDIATPAVGSPTAGIRNITSDSGASASLSSFLNNAYENDASIVGKYLVVRFSYDAALAPSLAVSNGARYFVTSSENTVFPQLVLTTTAIPEPSAAAAIAGTLVLGGVACRRRRRVA